MDAITPLQCFIGGLVSSSLLCSALGLLLWSHYNKLRKQDPDYFTNLAKEARRKKEQKAALEEEGVHLRRREVELMEQIVANQEVMIGLLRQSLEEKVLS